MKDFRTWMGKTAMVLSAFFVLFTSCDNKEPLPEEEDGKQEEVVADPVADSLENVMTRQAKAMRTLLLEEGVGVSSCAKLSDGTYSVTLSSGLSFVSLPSGAEYSSMVTFEEAESEKVWALLSKDGVSAPVLKTSGKKCPLAEELALVLEEDKYFASINGENYQTDFVKEDAVQVFNCSFQADANGDVYAVTFDFGNNNPATYFVTDYKGVAFRLPYGENPTVTEFYVHYGMTSAITLDIPSGVDYKLVASQGWAVQKKESGSAVSVEITAPDASEGIASGEIQVLSATGDVLMASLSVSAEAFRAVTASATNVIVTPYTGVRKFVYGLVDVEQYSDEDAVSKASGVAAGGSAPAGCGVAEAALTKSITELLGGELDPDKRYVLWAVPVFYVAGSDVSVVADAVRKYEFGAMSFDIDVIDTKLLDAQLKVTVKGADAVFGGVHLKEEGFMDEIVYQIDNSIQDSIVVSNQNFVFEGLMSDYPAVDGYRNELEPAQTYIVWVAPAVTGDYKYTADDVTYVEVTTNSVTSGGNLEVAISDVVMTPSTFSANLKADGAALIYYAFLDKSTGDRYASAADEDKYAQMMKKSPLMARGGEVAAAGKKLNPSTTYWLYAVAVDEEGRYGKVACVSGKTTKLEYDLGIKLTVEKVDVTAKKAVLKVTSTGDLSDYIYWAGSAMDPFWANSTSCGGDKDIAQKYMALNPDDENIRRAMNKYGAIGADGIITLNGLNMQSEYVFAILEKGDANFSKIGYIKVLTLEADLGEIVVEGSEKWEAAKSTIKIDWLKNKFSPKENSQMQAYYGFNFSCPSDMTAYILCASDLYYAEMKKVEDIMIDIENTTSRRYDNGTTPTINGEYAQEPDYYKNGELKNGQLVNVYEFCCHGVPLMGFATYFAKGSHGEGNCIYWENGKCTAWEYGSQAIANLLTITPWEQRADQFGLTGQEKIDWSKALLEAYNFFYKDATPVIYENDGQPLEMANPYANGINDEGLIPDRVIVMLKDLQGNYYHPMYFEVPNYFE